MLTLLKKYSSKIFLELIRYKYGFDKWHSLSPINTRPYRLMIASYVNNLNINSVVEIGCGLGLNLKYLSNAECYGFDRCEKVIRAAKFLNKSHISFFVGSFSDVKINSYDLLLAINFLSEFKSKEVKSFFNDLEYSPRYILVDSVWESSCSSTRFRHDFNQILPNYKLVDSFTIKNEKRSFLLYCLD